MAMAASASASTSTSTAADSNNIYNRYDVFISHRGPDVKKTLASHLYRRLISYGLQVFLDYQEMQEGEDLTCQIQGAIRTASAHVAIFSPTYADSKWCLDELVLMLESGAPIIPVFHHVHPSELRHTRGEGVYARSLHNLEKKRDRDSQPRYSSTTVQNWRTALSRVADKSGLDLEACNEDEGELLDKVVAVVLKKCSITQLNVARYPTGLNEKVEDFERKVVLQQNSGTVQVVGITGLGGVGKTTLAKELFNRKSSNYSKSYCLFDIRENAKSSLQSLQSKLLKGLLQLEMHIDNSYQGIETLKKHLSDFHILLVLDDVDHVDQVNALLPVDFLRHDSLVLITSRDKNVLLSSGVQESSIYRLTGLDRERSRELFCSHAFCQPHPLSGFENLVAQFLTACSGLPLSLKVFGGLLYGNTDKSYWEDELERLEQILPDEIHKKLQISYDALQRDEQQMFLDIACFFIGNERDTVIKVWDGLGLKGSRGFQNLLNKSLVEVEIMEHSYYFDGTIYKNCIRMHDHLRDLGRDLAKDSRLPCRLWCGTKNIDDFLQQSFEATEVRGIRMFSSGYGDNEECSGIRMLPSGYGDNEECSGIRMLPSVYGDDEVCSTYGDNKVGYGDNEEGYGDEEVCSRYGGNEEGYGDEEVCSRYGGNEEGDGDDEEWTYFQRCKMKKLQLLDIDMREDLLRCILRGVESPKLIWLRWHNCPSSYLPPCIPMKKLWVLEVDGKELETLWPEESQAPVQLRVLRIQAPLSNIPDSIGRLKHLEQVVVVQGKFEKLPEEFFHLHSLKHLELRYNSRLRSLPDSFGNLTNLEHINLCYCTVLERLPNSFGNLIKVKYLDLVGCSNLSLSSGSFGSISTLENIHLGGAANNIQVLPSQIAHQPSLEKLYLCLPHLIEWPSATGEGSGLVKLILETPSLQTLPASLGRDLRNLKLLEMRRCRRLKRLPGSVLLLNQLTTWLVEDCPLQVLPFKTVEGESGTLRDSEGQRASSSLDSSFERCLLRLQYLKLGNTQISEVSFPTGVCPNLQHLDIRDCKDLVEVGTLPNALVKLELIGCSKLNKIEEFCGLTRLQKLKINWCKELHALPSVETMVSLKELQAIGCVKVKSIMGLARLTKLRELDVSHCSELEGLPGLEHLRSLEKLWASECVKLKSINGLAQLTQLRELIVSRFSELEELPGLEHLRSLEKLWAFKCVKLKSIQGSAQLTQLRELDVGECSELEELPGVEHLRSLEKLRAFKCVKLKSIQGSAQLTQLRELDVGECSELEELPGLEHLRSLEKLWAFKCVKLKSIQGSAQLTQLRELDVGECSELEELPGLEHLRSLEKLRAFKCVKLKSIQGSAQLTQLRELDVGECSELEELPGLEHLRSLEKLRAFKCVKLKSIQGSAQLTQLRELDVRECSELEALPGFEHLRSLVKLWAFKCVKLKSIQGSAQLTQLRELDVRECSELEGLPGLEHLRALEKLRAFKCVKLKSIQGSAQLTQLRELDVRECSELEGLPGLEHLRALEKLWAFKCVKLKSIQGSAKLTQLRELDVRECSELEELLGFEHLRSLEILRPLKCVKLKSIQGLPKMIQLTELDVHECSELEEWPAQQQNSSFSITRQHHL